MYGSAISGPKKCSTKLKMDQNYILTRDHQLRLIGHGFEDARLPVPCLLCGLKASNHWENESR